MEVDIYQILLAWFDFHLISKFGYIGIDFANPDKITLITTYSAARIITTASGA